MRAAVHVHVPPALSTLAVLATGWGLAKADSGRRDPMPSMALLLTRSL